MFAIFTFVTFISDPKLYRIIRKEIYKIVYCCQFTVDFPFIFKNNQ